MARNKIKFTSGVVFIALLIGANVLLLLPQKYTARVNYFFVKITSPIVNLIPRSNPSKNDTVKKSEYDKLLVQYKNLQADLEVIIEKNRILSGIRQKLPKPGPAIVIANVSKITLEGQLNELIISKGSDDGLKKGQYVLSTEPDPETGLAGSVIGTISELSKTMSRVKLVTDANHNIKVEIWRDGSDLGISGIMWGNNKIQANILKLQANIPLIVRKQYDIRVDDSVYAKRKFGFLETPLVVGQIIAIKPDDQDPLLWDITITPVVDIRALTDVAIVIIDMDTTSDEEGE
ncbi:MAG: hypothetical protein FVQ82_05905 [Planctomycetes bacterium]|nr:hypothetical protein [Planctomycetota bacterium]